MKGTIPEERTFLEGIMKGAIFLGKRIGTFFPIAFEFSLNLTSSNVP